MAVTRFDRGKLNAFVQSPLFARNSVGGFRIYCGAKKWRGIPRWPFTFRAAQPNAVIGGTVYIAVSGTKTLNDGSTPLKYHSVGDKFGNGIQDPRSPSVFYSANPWVSADPLLPHRVVDEGSDPPIDPGLGQGPDFPLPTEARDENGGFPFDNLNPVNQVINEATTDTHYYSEVWSEPPSEPPGIFLESYDYTLSSPYSLNDALADALAVARGGASIGVGFCKTGIYEEESGTFDSFGPSPFARAPFAVGASMWYAGWNLQGLTTTVLNPLWSGTQKFTGARKLIDQGDAINFDNTPLGMGNPHKGYLVARANTIFDGDFPNVVRVVCSTFSGAGALATYEENQSAKNRPIPRKMSCVDIVANNLALDPGFPSVPVPGALASGSRWQIFFPGKKASEIPDPNLVWNA
jgi:hypothetical protein